MSKSSSSCVRRLYTCMRLRQLEVTCISGCASCTDSSHSQAAFALHAWGCVRIASCRASAALARHSQLSTRTKNAMLTLSLSVCCTGATLLCTAKSWTSNDAGRRAVQVPGAAHGPPESAISSSVCRSLRSRGRPATATRTPASSGSSHTRLPRLRPLACPPSASLRAGREGASPVGPGACHQGAFYSISSTRLPCRGPALFTYSTSCRPHAFRCVVPLL